MNKMELQETLVLISGKSVKHIVKNICGEKLGHGATRAVYVLKHNPKYVVKIEHHPENGDFANVGEFRNYLNYSETFLQNWLAPCQVINETGQVLIQQRVYNSEKKHPEKIPTVFTDTKRANFGWIKNKFVCCDYSFLVFPLPNKLKRAKWWDCNSKEMSCIGKRPKTKLK